MEYPDSDITLSGVDKYIFALVHQHTTFLIMRVRSDSFVCLDFYHS